MLEQDLTAEELWQDPTEAPALARHLLRVAHLSLLVGTAAGLHPDALQDLGVAALFHDCGYAAGGHTGAGPVGLREHPMAGARLLMRQKGFHEAKTRRVLVALQHHRDANAQPRPGLFGRIVRIAEDYDTLSRRSGKLSPTMALATMLKAAGTLYDPVLLQLLINTLGAYPPGTFLQLEDGRIVRSMAPGPGPEGFTTPIARCVRLADGSSPPPGPPPVDLKAAGRLRVLRASS
jgi:response regulator RpfG family c-di-GMP phosphodiesterase